MSRNTFLLAPLAVLVSSTIGHCACVLMRTTRSTSVCTTRDLSALLPTLKQQQEYPWLSEVASVPLQQTLRHLDRAFLNFFEGRAQVPQVQEEKEPASLLPMLALPSSGMESNCLLPRWTGPLDIRLVSTLA